MRAVTLACALVLAVAGGDARGRLSASVPPQVGDNPELAKIYEADQADRVADLINWAVLEPRDKARLARVKELFATKNLRTAVDFYRAAMVLQHGQVAEDFLLAHELCVVAIALGKSDRATRWLAAASEDRFLMTLGRPQRFGTQYRSEGSQPMRLYDVGEGVTDELRTLMATPTLAEAKAREAEMAK
jgi:hypothetical protein